MFTLNPKQLYEAAYVRLQEYCEQYGSEGPDFGRLVDELLQAQDGLTPNPTERVPATSLKRAV